MNNKMSRPTRAAAALIAALSLSGLAACGGGSDDPEPKASSAAPAAEEPSSAPAAESDAPAAAAGQPAWAQAPTQVGEKMTTIKAGDLTVDVYQVGTAKATKSGQFVDPDTNKPIISAGDDIVFVNYVVTNNGDPIDLGSSLVDVQARYDDWKYLQGMDSIVDDALFKQQNVNDDDLAPGAFNEAGVYTLGTGEKFSFGENFRYQQNSPIGFKVKATPVDAEGELLHDQAVEGEGKGVIK